MKTRHNDYRCCYCCCHVRTGTIVIGAVELIYLIYQLITTIYLYASSNNHQLSFIVTLFGIAVGCIAIALLAVGIVIERAPYLLIPHLLMQALASLTLVALAALCLLAAFTGSTVAIRIVNQSDDEHRSTNALGAYQPLPDLTIVSSTLTLTLCTIAILFMISAAIQLWTFTVVLSYYRYLHAKVRVQPTTALTLSSGRCVDECVLSASYSKAVSGAALAAAVQLSKSTSSSSGGSTSETTTDL